MTYSIAQLEKRKFPEGLGQIPDPPKKLWYAGTLPNLKLIPVCFVGSRKHSPYGASVCRMLIEGLQGYPVSIVSGLAHGIDSIAHRAALDFGIHTIAIPGSGLDPSVIYPRAHAHLAHEIVDQGGVLISEFEPLQQAAQWTFPARNRIMAGISHTIIVIEAEVPSGTLITARLGTEYNKNVFAVPGSIFSPQSDGPNMLISLGATPCRSARDILEFLNINEIPRESLSLKELSPDEQILWDILVLPHTKDELVRKSRLPFQRFNTALSLLELKKLVQEHMGELIRNTI